MEARFCTQCGQALAKTFNKKSLECRQCDLVTYNDDKMVVFKPRGEQHLEAPSPEATHADSNDGQGDTSEELPGNIPVTIDGDAPVGSTSDSVQSDIERVSSGEDSEVGA